MCMGVNRKVKLEEVTRLGGLYTTLSKERGFGVQRMVNYGGVTRKFMGEPMNDKGNFTKFCFCKLISVSALSL